MGVIREATLYFLLLPRQVVVLAVQTVAHLQDCLLPAVLVAVVLVPHLALQALLDKVMLAAIRQPVLALVVVAQVQ
jgi:hypothetical protein